MPALLFKVPSFSSTVYSFGGQFFFATSRYPDSSSSSQYSSSFTAKQRHNRQRSLLQVNYEPGHQVFYLCQAFSPSDVLLIHSGPYNSWISMIWDPLSWETAVLWLGRTSEVQSGVRSKLGIWTMLSVYALQLLGHFQPKGLEPDILISHIRGEIWLQNFLLSSWFWLNFPPNFIVDHFSSQLLYGYDIVEDRTQFWGL